RGRTGWRSSWTAPPAVTGTPPGACRRSPRRSSCCTGPPSRSGVRGSPVSAGATWRPRRSTTSPRHRSLGPGGTGRPPSPRRGGRGRAPGSGLVVGVAEQDAAGGPVPRHVHPAGGLVHGDPLLVVAVVVLLVVRVRRAAPRPPAVGGHVDGDPARGGVAADVEH